jgi:hypothetical protein
MKSYFNLSLPPWLYSTHLALASYILNVLFLKNESEVCLSVWVSSYYPLNQSVKGKAVPLHAMEALAGRGGIAPTQSRPRH